MPQTAGAPIIVESSEIVQETPKAQAVKVKSKGPQETANQSRNQMTQNLPRVYDSIDLAESHESDFKRMRTVLVNDFADDSQLGASILDETLTDFEDGDVVACGGGNGPSQSGQRSDSVRNHNDQQKQQQKPLPSRKQYLDDSRSDIQVGTSTESIQKHPFPLSKQMGKLAAIQKSDKISAIQRANQKVTVSAMTTQKQIIAAAQQKLAPTIP